MTINYIHLQYYEDFLWAWYTLSQILSIVNSDSLTFTKDWEIINRRDRHLF